MDYELAGFTFHFDLDGSGDVIAIVTPPINIGPVMVLPANVIGFDPAITVDAAKASVRTLLTILGLYP